MSWPTTRHWHNRTQAERHARGVAQVAALRASLAQSNPPAAAVQKTCGNCGRSFTTSSAAEHACEVCAPRQEAA